MKHVAFALSGAVSVVVVVLILLSLHSRDIRRVELERNLDAAAAQSLKNACVTYRVPIEDNDALVADFIRNFLGKMKSDGKNIEISIYEADIYKGILSAQAKEQYTHPNGRKGTIEATTTSIVERESRRPGVVMNYYLSPEIAEKAGLDYGSSGNVLYHSRRYTSGQSDRRRIQAPDVTGMKFIRWKTISEKEDGSRDVIAVYQKRGK